MKVLFVLNSGFDTPGPSNHLLESIIKHLLLSGCNIHIIEKHKTGQNPDIPKSLEHDYLSYETIKATDVKKTSFVRRYLEDIKYAISCSKLYKKHKDSDVIFLQSCNTAFFHHLFLKLIIKKPVVYNVQDIFPLNAQMIGKISRKSIIYKILRFLQNMAYKMADKIITISHDMKNTLVEEMVQEEKIEVIYNWSYSDEFIDISYEDNQFMKVNKIDKDIFKVVYAGNIGEVQNIDIIMLAAKLLKEDKNIVFYIIGDGVQKEKHVEFKRENNLNNVIFLPMQSSDIAPHIYSMANINIVPLSKGIIKTALPSKTATCLSCGKPIIACVDKDTYFANTIGSLENCSVVDSDDAHGLANSIKEIYSTYNSGKAVDQRSLFKQVFNKEKNVQDYVNVIKDLAKPS